MSQTGLAAVVAGTGSQPRLETHDRASQIVARLVCNGHARRAMRVEFPARYFNLLSPTTTGRQGSHDLFDTNFRSAPVIGRSTAPHAARGEDADQLEVFSILNHRLRSPRLRITHRLRGLCLQILRRTAQRRFDWFHHIATTTDFLFFLHDLRNDSLGSPYYSQVLGGCQVHRRRCYTSAQ